jgi:hypothetical protein
MGGTAWGVVGAAVGVLAGATAALSARRRRSNVGAPTQPEPVVAFREVLRSDGIERFIYQRAAAWSFLVVLIVVGVIGALDAAFDWANVGHWIFGTIWGVAGLAFGTSSAIIARRTA